MVPNSGYLPSRIPQISPSSRRQGTAIFSWLVALLSVALLSVDGCGDTELKNARGLTLPGFSGQVSGGGQPISGSSIRLYAAGKAGDGSASTPLLQAPVSSDSQGEFSIPSFSCPSASSDIYLTATGGSPALQSSAVNPQIAEMVALGPCGNGTESSRFRIDEASTVAAVYALAPFMKSYREVGSGPVDSQLFTDAFTVAGELVDIGTGAIPATKVPAGQTVPAEKLRTLANILATCVNSPGGRAGDGSACGSLFSIATPATGTPPADTIEALLDIANNPAYNVIQIFALSPTLAPFKPALAVAPIDWTLSLTSSIPSPVLSPAPGTYPAGSSVSLYDVNASAEIHYTTDGSTPTLSSNVYSGAKPLSATGLIRAIAVAAGVSSVPVAGLYSPQPSTVTLGGAEQSAVTTATPIAVAVATSKISLTASQTQAFSATVTNSANSAVTWSLSPAVGTISAAGLYTAPPSIFSAQTVTVKATSAADPTKSAVATVSLTVPAIPATFFGLSVLDFPQLNPSMSFGTTRSWDAGPGLDWSDANPSFGIYNFSPLDQFIAFNQARGSQGIYTFGRTPQWASSQPNNLTSPYGPGECAPPSSISYWDDYVTAIATHAAGRIKYWELWNEPNEATYCGDMPTIITMAQHAYQIIKGIDPTALILSPSPDKASGPAWLQSFFSGGGAGSVDVIAFHGYWSSTAEDIVTVVAGVQKVAAANGLANLPIWDTESSWAYTSNMPMPTSASQTAYIAKYYLLHWSLGIARFSWYAYDASNPWGTFYTYPAGETPAAAAYSETYKWMVGATFTAPCSETNGIWSCQMTRPGGYVAKALWMSNGSAPWGVPSQYKQYLDLAGVVHPIPANGIVTAGNVPILLETGPIP